MNGAFWGACTESASKIQRPFPLGPALFIFWFQEECVLTINSIQILNVAQAQLGKLFMSLERLQALRSSEGRCLPNKTLEWMAYSFKRAGALG